MERTLCAYVVIKQLGLIHCAWRGLPRYPGFNYTVTVAWVLIVTGVSNCSYRYVSFMVYDYQLLNDEVIMNMQ